MSEFESHIQTRIDDLRKSFAPNNIDGFYIPKVDEFMGEYIRPCDERLAWISGFTGSAGFALITQNKACLFADGRYTIQAARQAPGFEIINWPQNDLPDFVKDERIGFDPLLIPIRQAQKWQEHLGEQFTPCQNLIDLIWQTRPAPPAYTLRILDETLAGESAKSKIKRLSAELSETGVDAFLSNNPESLAWLLNIRGGTIPMVPAPQGYFILHKSGDLDVFVDVHPNFETAAKFQPLAALENTIQNFNGIMGYNAALLPFGRLAALQNPKAITDPVIKAKAQKNKAEIKASHRAHDLDGRAMIRFLAWLDAQDPTTLDEIKCAEKLLECRQSVPEFKISSFDTISAWGANAANPHYHATHENCAKFEENGVYLVDSGGHYPGATTDITRTIAIGKGIEAAKTPFTQVLNGLASISSCRFPKGSAGRDIDVLARASLWHGKRNFNHGTGHGVGAELSVHEGPASISPRGEVPLEKGMILSLEPGFYQQGEFGIRLENLGLVFGGEEFYEFETLSFVPLDLLLIDPEIITPQARIWLNEYHQKTYAKHIDFIGEFEKNWLKIATAAI